LIFNYKQTDGATSDGWVVKPIADVAPFQRGFDLPTSRVKDGPYPVVYSNGVLNFHLSFMARGPGVVTGRSGTLGKVHYIETDYWPHNTSLWVTNFKGNNPKFVYYLYCSIGLERFGSGSGVPTLNRNDVHTHRVGLPSSFEEQSAIAGALGDVDGLLSVLTRLIAKKREVKHAVMQQLLSGQTRLPRFSGKWEAKRLRSVLSFQVGFPFRSQYFNENAAGIRLVKNRDLKSDDQMYHYTGPFDQSFIVRDGDVLVGMDGDFIPCRWNKGQALLNQRVGRIRTTSELDQVFAYYFLIEPLKKIELMTSSTTVKHLSHGDIENIERPLPSSKEQAAIAAILSDIDAEIAALERRLAKTRDLKQGMMQELLTGRTRLV
jgi:type I restriction enzyme, S subunit